MSLFAPVPHFAPDFKPLAAPVYPLDGDAPSLRWLPRQAYFVRILLVVLRWLSSALMLCLGETPRPPVEGTCCGHSLFLWHLCARAAKFKCLCAWSRASSAGLIQIASFSFQKMSNPSHARRRSDTVGTGMLLRYAAADCCGEGGVRCETEESCGDVGSGLSFPAPGAPVATFAPLAGTCPLIRV